MSLRTRLLASFAYVLLLVIVALEVPLVLNLQRRVETEVEANASGQAQVIAASVAGRPGDREQLETVAREAAEDLGGRVVILGNRGGVLADSAGRGLAADAGASRPEVRSALAGEPAQEVRHSAALDQDVLYTAVPVFVNGRPVGAVRVSQSLAPARDETRRDTVALVGVGAAALALGLLTAWLVAGSVARPLGALARTVRRIADGDLGARAEVAGSREQREVAVAFNDMADRLATMLVAQREFVANASHQLRTPLTGLRLRLEAASLKADRPELARDLEAAERESERLAKLLSDLLTLAREGGEPTSGASVALADAAADALERWRAPARRAGHELVLSGDCASRVHASREDVAMALDNLLENAINYSPPGTTVTLECEGSDGWASVAVLDQGPGIEPEEQERVFERFFRGSSSRGGAPGTGLGLAIVDALARRWGGRAELSNRPEGGARAELVLPAESADEGVDKA